MSKDLDYYMALPYRVEVIPDEEEGGFALHCPELSGCMTCAETLEEGFKMLEDAKRCWFTACIEDGIPIPRAHAPGGLQRPVQAPPAEVPAQAAGPAIQ